MELKNIPDPGFPDDDGSADPRLAAALAAYAKDRSAEREVLAALPGARLLIPVVAVLGEVEIGEDGLRREKTSDMAVPTLEAPGGRRALPAFTSTDSLARWQADARPVAVPFHQALQALAHEKADTLLIDMAGPVTYQLTGSALRAAAEGRGQTEAAADPAVAEAVRAACAAEPAVLRAHLMPSTRSDLTLGLVLAEDADVRQVGGRLAAALSGDETLRGRLVRGLELAVLPPDARVPGEPVHTRRSV
ncbi:SseB family protein [Streptomyces sp. SCUT-3]|uniref:SseB family protein n=1 Tax=Streptomyces sp. SCUT-3 TaxID=2684469 RepID=UPI0015FC2E8F|nr:SseB family protein [Streptomyces sp. SCUT-3]QMV24161.1 SseB family protein [Streptomyces sp. SCUT-3]